MSKLFKELQSQSQAQSPQNQKLPLSETQVNNLKNLLNSNDPQTLVQNMIKNNPKMNNVFQMFKASKMSPKQFFFQYAQDNGIDPSQLLNILQQQ